MMKGHIKPTILVLTGFAISAITGLVFIYLASESYLTTVSYDAPFLPADLNNEALVSQGQHIARTRGCFGCHGQQLQGKVFEEEWDWVARAVAPNLAQYAKRFNSEVVEAAVRQGIGHDGRALWSMPSYNFALLSDQDMAALIAYLRAAPVVTKALPSPSLGWAARLRMVTGKSQHMAIWADAVPPLTMSASDDPQLMRGEYIAKTTCNECHGLDLRGQSMDGVVAPDLAIVSAYSDEAFRKLMKTGVALGERDNLILMSMIARDRFAYFKEDELVDLLAYLRQLPAHQVDKNASWKNLE